MSPLVTQAETPSAAWPVIANRSERVTAFHDEIASKVPCFPNNGAKEMQLRQKSLGELLIYYLNFAGRQIPIRPRSVKYASSFWPSFDFHKHGALLAELERKIKFGEDLSTHLSKDARSKGFGGDKRKKIVAPEKDLILNAFALHHLHLLTKGRGDDLAFVHFDQTSATFLMAGTHKSFMDGSVAEASARIQAATGNHHNGLRPSNEPFDFKQQMRLAHVGLSGISSIEGKITVGPFITTSTHSVRHNRYANHILRTINEMDPQLDDRVFIERLFASASHRLQERSEFKWTMNYTDLMLIESISRIGINICAGFC